MMDYYGAADGRKAVDGYGITQPWKKKYSPMEWFANILPTLASEKKPLECIMRTGDTIFVPSGWWHAVINLEVTIAVTENWAGNFNVEQVMAELLKRPRTQMSASNDGSHERLSESHRCAREIQSALNNKKAAAKAEL